MFSSMGRFLPVVVLAAAMILGFSSAQVRAQCRSGQQQSRSQQRCTMQTTLPQRSTLQTAPPQYTMLTALQQQNAMLGVLQQQYAMLISLQQQYAMLSATQRPSAVRTVSYVPRLSNLDSSTKRTELIVISSGRSTTLSNSVDADTAMSTMDDAAGRKLNMAQMLVDAGLAKRFQGKSAEATRLLQRARKRFQEIVATYTTTEAAAEARKKLASLAD